MAKEKRSTIENFDGEVPETFTNQEGGGINKSDFHLDNSWDWDDVGKLLPKNKYRCRILGATVKKGQNAQTKDEQLSLYVRVAPLVKDGPTTYESEPLLMSWNFNPVEPDRGQLGDLKGFCNAAEISTMELNNIRLQSVGFEEMLNAIATALTIKDGVKASRWLELSIYVAEAFEGKGRDGNHVSYPASNRVSRGQYLPISTEVSTDVENS